MVIRFKKYLLVALACFFIVILTFTLGTFNPNFIKIKELEQKLETKIVSRLTTIDFYPPVFDITDEISFVKSIEKCVNYLNFKIPPNERIPYILIAAQSSLESNFGTSRFAIEANNILGIRTYNKEDKQIKSKSNPNAEWGLKVFTTKCACVDYYIKLLNNHNAYKKFRESRIKLNNSGFIYPKKLAETLTSYASEQNYIPKVKKQIDYLIGILGNNAG